MVVLSRSGHQSTMLRTPFGVALCVTASDTAIVDATFVRRPVAGPTSRHPVLRDAAQQVRAYFARRLRRFDVPLCFEGTAMQCAVWDAVAQLAYGDVVSYADVARAIGRPRTHRAVAAALRESAIALFVPAHRVVGADGRVRGCGPRSVRARLLAFERQPLR